MSCYVKLTIGANLKIYNGAYADVDDSKKSLILFLELLLVKNLYGQSTVFIGFPREPIRKYSPSNQGCFSHISKLSFQYGFSVFFITEVVRVCSPDIVATAKGSGNPRLEV